MGSTSRRDGGYSRSLSPSDNNLPYSSSRPSDRPQTDRPSQSQNNNQLTDVSSRQQPAAPPVRPSYSDFMKQRLPNERPDTATGSSSGAGSSRTRESRPAENRTSAIPIATSSSYQTTARRNDTVRHETRDVEHETRSRGGLVSPRVVVVLAFVIPHQQRSGQHPVNEDRRGAVAQSSSSAKPSGRSTSKDVPPQSQTTAVRPPAGHPQYENRGVPPNERHPSIPGPDAMTRKDMPPSELHHSTSQFHIQPISGFLVTPGPGNLLIQQGSTTGQTTLPANFPQVVGHFQQPPPPPYHEPRVHPPTRGEPPSGSREGIYRETYNESTPHPLMVRPHPLGSHTGQYITETSRPLRPTGVTLVDYLRVDCRGYTKLDSRTCPRRPARLLACIALLPQPTVPSASNYLRSLIPVMTLSVLDRPWSITEQPPPMSLPDMIGTLHALMNLGKLSVTTPGLWQD